MRIINILLHMTELHEVVLLSHGYTTKKPFIIEPHIGHCACVLLLPLVAVEI